MGVDEVDATTKGKSDLQARLTLKEAVGRSFVRANRSPPGTLSAPLEVFGYVQFGQLVHDVIGGDGSVERQQEELCLIPAGVFNGCNDHNYVTSELYDAMRRKNKKTFCVVWYELRNAFGSVPNALIWYTLAKPGLPPSFLSRIQD
ncbi:TPA: hypothetical protein N0F65_006050 [Lagenidium giganteum]|uniref:Uncharacterized protein n=1 Tax=Lagenidium giganteum TaxID=4803 RepID=A0AAV2YMA5_9STRA|nr:TPA: hypothetical protein N0F65_006050 [Lagenidium giganteum]